MRHTLWMPARARNRDAVQYLLDHSSLRHYAYSRNGGPVEIPDYAVASPAAGLTLLWQVALSLAGHSERVDLAVIAAKVDRDSNAAVHHAYALLAGLEVAS